MVYQGLMCKAMLTDKEPVMIPESSIIKLPLPQAVPWGEPHSSTTSYSCEIYEHVNISRDKNSTILYHHDVSFTFKQ